MVAKTVDGERKWEKENISPLFCFIMINFSKVY